MTEEEERQLLIPKAKAALEIQRRYREERLKWFYNPCSPKHRAFHESTKSIRIVFGGNRSGKSTLGLIELLWRACCKFHPLTKEPCRKDGRFRIFTERYQLVETFIVPLLQDWIPKKLLINGDWEQSYDSRNHIIHLKHGPIIDLMTYDQTVAGAASVELDGVWMDEEAPQKLFSETMTRLISRNGKLWVTVTPMYSMTWAMEYWNKTDDPNVDVFKMSIHDNPHLPADAKAAIIANWPEHERKTRESGEFMEFSGLVYSELDHTVHFLNESKQPESHYPVIMAMDPHPRKATVITWAYVDDNDDVVFFDELEMKGTAKDVVSAILAKESAHKAPTQLRLIDPAANKQISGFGSEVTTLIEFEREGMGFTLANNNEAGYNAVHEYLHFDKSKPVDLYNRPHCYFTSDCQKTWKSLTSLLWDEYKFQKELRDPKEHVKDKDKDFPDCVRYTLVERPSSRRSRFAPIPMNKSITPSQNQKQDLKSQEWYQQMFPRPYLPPTHIIKATH